MTGPVSSSQDSAATSARVALRLSRGVTATWWYTFGGIVFFEAVLAFIWTVAVFQTARSAPAAAVVGGAGLVWVAATIPLLLDYRSRVDAARSARWRRAVVPLAVGVLCGATAGLVSGTWIIAFGPVALMLVLLKWAPGMRWRVVVAATVLLGALWIIDARLTFPDDPGGSWWLVGFFSTFLPFMAVITLWWWDVLVALDRARLSEARLAATQERLRVATDVHDLQGHHLQVIALQLELAERLMGHDPDAALAQLQAARTSVDEARQGTRDLATRFRSVPLSDELANAADLLRAAGTTVDALVDAGADDAPASVLGPVIREATTNVLRHGGGAWARLSLAREGQQWRLEIANDAVGGAAETALDERGGAGLSGMGRRVAEVGGSLDVRPGRSAFTIVVTVPARPEGAQ